MANGPTGRIVVGVDGSTSALAALDWAAGWAEKTGNTLEIATAWQWPKSYGMALPVPSDFDPAAVAKEVNRAALDHLRKDHPVVEAVPNIVEGPAGQALVELSGHADVLVVGSRGHGETVGLLIGSVSEYCVAHAHCPVLVRRGH